MVAATPWQGGATWAVLQYVLGFQRLGHEVCLVEPIAGKDLAPIVAPLSQSENAQYFKDLLERFGLAGKAALLLGGSRETVGLSYSELEQVAGRADILINISGMLTDARLLARIPIRVYLDLDPAFNQLWSAVQNIDMRFANHTHHVTIGLNLGDSDCPVPTCGLNWLKTLQPVCLDHWPVANGVGSNSTNPGPGAFTTIGHWRGYGSISHQGVRYGQKAHSLRQFLDLPKLVPETFRLALAIHPAETEDLARLKDSGWELADPAQVARTPRDYHDFIRSSKAEFGVCKSGYALSRCGWFSDRSACYLASGRPVVAQDTGFDRHLPCGQGLLAFENTAQAVAAITSINADYPSHCAAARRIAEEYFDSDKVLRRLLNLVGA